MYNTKEAASIRHAAYPKLLKSIFNLHIIITSEILSANDLYVSLNYQFLAFISAIQLKKQWNWF